ncbi:MAG: leucine-rich repeat domain-containing protein [Coriobacteriia bacterium]|nr:leucine-rich repeat domain-containing protein [Coriobacteriia bacterium]
MKTLTKKLQLILALTAVCFFLSITVVTTNAYADEGDVRYVDSCDGTNYILHKGATPEENTATLVSPENGKYTHTYYNILEKVSYADVTYKVVEIGDNTFADCENLEGIYIQNGFLKRLGNNAFFKCTNLEKITLSSNKDIIFDYIGKKAFYGCKKLEEFAIYNCTLKAIGDQAFYSCSNLKRFHLCTTEKIDFGQCVFGCSPNVQFEMPGTPDQESYYTVCDGGLYSADMKTLYAYPSATGTVTIKDGVENIAPSALACCKDLKKIIFPKSVKSIGKYAFTPIPGNVKKYDFEFKGAKPNIDKYAFDRVTRIDITYDHNYIVSWYNSRANLGGAIIVNYKMI